mmetsp:Transcript_63643/g.113261  ORF Transcript_63643/g.113261 Transcript_63643/m.113261 type:complete len:561 (+) Transcript_63643:46-1728(+)|eukprot:CAMPEP_0197625954 /NCGR_PEP_ID=MMETSP1338-20131121/5150_1 /TAXON_ID=43686 ORGANISM="Pelagodinium beii, Strain RCC1491" /NCGR_SAMPLE_ID=MMETSP1338 /ASSEMBLY_ACC=CAM_ASM_000754 /LENGTH=560 /DNA_ID=CAMNT_0043196467 /DNA_START=46 /DNA_END=1728 /DNA_ORIENTATION=+
MAASKEGSNHGTSLESMPSSSFRFKLEADGLPNIEAALESPREGGSQADEDIPCSQLMRFLRGNEEDIDAAGGQPQLTMKSRAVSSRVMAQDAEETPSPSGNSTGRGGDFSCRSPHGLQKWPATPASWSTLEARASSPGGFSHLPHARTPQPQLYETVNQEETSIQESPLASPVLPKADSKKETTTPATVTPAKSSPAVEERSPTSLVPPASCSKKENAPTATVTPAKSAPEVEEDAPCATMTPAKSAAEEEACTAESEKPSKKRRLSQRAVDSKVAAKAVKVPLETLSEPAVTGRPARNRLPPLAHWCNERVIFERKPGSLLPTVAAVALMPQEKSSGATRSREGFQDSCAVSDAGDEEEEVTPPRGKRSPRVALSDRQRSSKKAPEPRQHAKPKSSGSSEVALNLEEELLKAADSESESQEAPVAAVAAKKKIKKMPVPPFIASRAPSESFHEMPMVDGSSHPCGIRIGLDRPGWTCCDIRVPPRSVSAAEKLTSGTAMVMYVIGAPQEANAFSVSINGEILGLRKGDSFLIRAGSEYYLENSSVAEYVHVKMVLVTR